MVKTKIISVNDISTNPGVFKPNYSEYVNVSVQTIETIHPKPIPKAFRVIWSDRINGNIRRNDGITYVHVFVRKINSGWSVFIQTEAGWQGFVKSKQEAEKLISFISSQVYAIDPEP